MSKEEIEKLRRLVIEARSLVTLIGGSLKLDLNLAVKEAGLVSPRTGTAHAVAAGVDSGVTAALSAQETSDTHLCRCECATNNSNACCSQCLHKGTPPLLARCSLDAAHRVPVALLSQHEQRCQLARHGMDVQGLALGAEGQRLGATPASSFSPSRSDFFYSHAPAAIRLDKGQRESALGSLTSFQDDLNKGGLGSNLGNNEGPVPSCNRYMENNVQGETEGAVVQASGGCGQLGIGRRGEGGPAVSRNSLNSLVGFACMRGAIMEMVDGLPICEKMESERRFWTRGARDNAAAEGVLGRLFAASCVSDVFFNLREIRGWRVIPRTVSLSLATAMSAWLPRLSACCLKNIAQIVSAELGIALPSSVAASLGKLVNLFAVVAAIEASKNSSNGGSSMEPGRDSRSSRSMQGKKKQESNGELIDGACSDTEHGHVREATAHGRPTGHSEKKGEIPHFGESHDATCRDGDVSCYLFADTASWAQQTVAPLFGAHAERWVVEVAKKVLTAAVESAWGEMRRVRMEEREQMERVLSAEREMPLGSQGKRGGGDRGNGGGGGGGGGEGEGRGFKEVWPEATGVELQDLGSGLKKEIGSFVSHGTEEEQMAGESREKEREEEGRDERGGDGGACQRRGGEAADFCLKGMVEGALLEAEEAAAVVKQFVAWRGREREEEERRRAGQSVLDPVDKRLALYDSWQQQAAEVRREMAGRFKSVVEYDGLMAVRRKLEDSENNGVEKVAAARDFKRRRTKFRSKSTKKRPLEVLRGVISSYMNEVTAAFAMEASGACLNAREDDGVVKRCAETAAASQGDDDYHRGNVRFEASDRSDTRTRRLEKDSARDSTHARDESPRRTSEDGFEAVLRRNRESAGKEPIEYPLLFIQDDARRIRGSERGLDEVVGNHERESERFPQGKQRSKKLREGEGTQDKAHEMTRSKKRHRNHDGTSKKPNRDESRDSKRSTQGSWRDEERVIRRSMHDYLRTKNVNERIEEVRSIREDEGSVMSVIEDRWEC